jgi:uncharacterized membrane protein YebE (DUF533 family)
MFDAKSLIEMMMKGAAQQPAPQSQGGLGGLGDLLGKIMQQQSGQPQGRGAPSGGGDFGGLGELLGKLGGGGGAQQPSQGSTSAQGGGLGDILGRLGGAAGQGRPAQPHAAPQQGGGGLEDMLRKLQEQLGGAGGAGGQGGSLMDVLGKVLGQATSGVKDGARKVDDMTNASGRMREATGQSPEQIMEQLKELIRQNPGAAAAGAGGLGAVVLGTRAGRALAGSAIKLGGLALIGGLAYKALQNYQAGRPLISGADPVAAAPQGSGFEQQAVTQESALLYVKAMIAAAAADGRIDANEQSKLLGDLKQLGLDDRAEEFLANELNNPASPAELAAACRSQEEAVQVFTAARVAIDLDTEEEHAFLVELAQALGMDGKLASHIDAAARNAA